MKIELHSDDNKDCKEEPKSVLGYQDFSYQV